MRSDGAHRMREYRARLRAGLTLLQIQVDEVALEELLAVHGLVSRWTINDRDTLAKGLAELVDRLILASTNGDA